MKRLMFSVAVIGMFSGCGLCGSSVHTNTCKPPLNCMGLAYDGSGSPCYRPPGPFWCCLPGPCSTCRDPWVQYYEDSCHSQMIGRHICQPEGLTYAAPPAPYPATQADTTARRVSFDDDLDDEDD